MVRFLSALFGFFFFLLIGIGCVGGIIYWYFDKDLPSYHQLAEYHPPVISRVYSSDGALIGEFAKQRRLFTPIERIPPRIQQAFVAAEDQNFYKHSGVDLMGIIHAMVRNVLNFSAGRRMQGASTITQQVMKNFLLTHERKLGRKIKEAILAVRFEQAFTKPHILELYLNEIFLGAGAYGVTTAAQIYFNKSLDELTIEEAAYLAALPKGPNNYHPKRSYDKAIIRRNYVIGRMAEDGYISAIEAQEAKAKPLVSTLGQVKRNIDATYYAEEVRRKLLEQYGEDVLYNAGLTITASIDPLLQKNAEQAFRNSLIALDKKLGWRGPLAKEQSTDDPEGTLSKFSTPSDLYDWRTALVTSISVDGKKAQIYVKEDKALGEISYGTLEWAVKPEEVQNITQILSKGDIIYVTRNPATKTDYVLCQIPKVNGAFMVMEPHSGRVLAQQGGFTFSQSQFNRATQAYRQPGSSFKTFVYAAALEDGYTPETLVNDGPFFYRDALGRMWAPKNYDKTYLGNVPMKIGMQKSRNLMTIRIAQDIGMRKVLSFARRFGVGDKMKAYLPMALGAGEVTLENMVTAYSTFANGGKKVYPIYYDRIQDRNGKTIVTADIPTCDGCLEKGDFSSNNQPNYILDPNTNHQAVLLLKNVVENGTARVLASLGIPMGGKTGTTNESKDVWFMGFTSNLVFGTYIGYDNPHPMGKAATGGGTAAPIVKELLTNVRDELEFRDFSAPTKRYHKYSEPATMAEKINTITKPMVRTPMPVNNTESSESTINNIIKSMTGNDNDSTEKPTSVVPSSSTQEPQNNEIVREKPPATSYTPPSTYVPSKPKEDAKKVHTLPINSNDNSEKSKVGDMLESGTGGLY